MTVALAALPAIAHATTGAIQGIVRDSGKAAVARARLRLRGEDTGLVRRTTTNADGIYVFAELPVGRYTIGVEAPGFQAASTVHIALSAAQMRAVDFHLVHGFAAEVDPVVVNDFTVQTLGGEVSGLVTGPQARELPLNGRNILQLIILVPGVAVTDGFSTRDRGLLGGADISISGGAGSSNRWLVDGADNNDAASNSTLLVYPSVDSVSEIKIQRNNYGAELGQAGGAQINFVTRGGTNAWQGSTYYYARRDELNATDYFLEQARLPEPDRSWDDVGATLGGPILKDKIHFFASGELNKDRRRTTRLGFVPSATERVGNFSGPSLLGCTGPAPLDPLTGQPFPGDRIPADRLSPAGLAMVKLYSLPNTTPGSGCNNWVEPVATPIDWRQGSGRLDWNVSDTSRMMIRYTQEHWKASDTNLWGDDPWPAVGSTWEQLGRSIVVQLTRGIGAEAVNSLTFSYSGHAIGAVRGGEDPTLVDAINAALPTSFPTTVKRQRGAAQPLFWGAGGYGALWNQAPWSNNQDLFVLKDDYLAVFGKHVIKIGAFASYSRKNEDSASTSQESVMFGGASGFRSPTGYVPGLTSGHALADLLLEDMVYATAELRRNERVRLRWHGIEGYLADSYKVRPHLTVDLGVRLSRLTMPYAADDRYGSFDPAAVNRALGDSPCNGVRYPPGTDPCRAAGLAGGVQGSNRQLQPQNAVLLAPRLGVAWDITGNGKSAVRGGLGLFYSRTNLGPALGMGLMPPFSGVASVTRTLDSAVSVTGQPAVSFGAPMAGWEQTAARPYNWQWNITCHRELVPNTTLEMSYVGSQGGNLLGATNLNEIPAGDRNGDGIADRVEHARTGNVALRPLNGIAGIGNGNVGLWQNNRRSIYHSLQAQLVSRFGSHGSQAQLAYTFAKSLSDVAIDGAASGNGISSTLTYTDSTRPFLDRGRSAFDRTHVLSGSLVLALPAVAAAPGLVRKMLGDWDITSIVSAWSGSPITVFTGSVPGLSGYGGASGTGYFGNQRPNRVAGQDCREKGESREQWLNPAAWTLDSFAIGAPGDSGRGICNGPRLFQVDVGLHKNIPLGNRATLQVRVEVFNVLDTVNLIGVNNLYNPSRVLFDTASGSTASTIVSATPAGNFGTLTSAREPRQVQLGLRVSF